MRWTFCQLLLVVAGWFMFISAIEFSIAIRNLSSQLFSFFWSFFEFILMGNFPSTICQCVDFSHPLHSTYLYYFHSSDYFFFYLEVCCSWTLYMVGSRLYYPNRFVENTHFIYVSNCHAIWCLCRFRICYLVQVYKTIWFVFVTVVVVVMSSYVLFLHWHYVTVCHFWYIG